MSIGDLAEAGINVTREIFAGGITMTGNRAANGGAIYVADGIFGIVDGTISGNTASGSGDGVYLTAGVDNAYIGGGNISATNSTGYAVYSQMSSIGMALAPQISGGKGLYLGTGKITNITVNTSGVSTSYDAYLSGASVLIDDSNAPSPFTSGWNSTINGDPSQYFTAVTAGKLAVLKNNEATFSSSSTGYMLINGTVVNITGDRIGYAGVSNESIDLYDGRHSGLTFGYTNDADDMLVLTIPESRTAPINFSVGSSVVAINVTGYTFDESAGTVNASKMWINASGATHPAIGENLTMVYRLPGTVKYAGIPTIRNDGGLTYTPTCSNFTISNGTTLSVSDYTTGIEADGRSEFIISSPDTSKTYTYTFKGTQLGDVDMNGKIDGSDLQIITEYILEEGSDWELDDAQLLYGDIKSTGGKGKGKVTIADLRALTTYVNTH